MYTFKIDEDRTLHFNKDINDKEKYCLASVVKNENDYLIEWVEHYKNLGFDKIFLGDNNEDDSLDILLKDYIDSGFIQLFNFRNTNYPEFQSKFNKMISSEGNYKWCAYYDADEFLELSIYSNIKDYLSTVPDNIYCVGFFWMIYGGNNQISYNNESLIKRFPQPCKPINYRFDNGTTKCIIRGGIEGFKMGCHYPDEWPENVNKKIYIGKREIDYNNYYNLHYPINYEDGWIKHYYTKSYIEFINKISRGWPDGNFKNDNISRTRGFAYYNDHNFSINDYLGSTVISISGNNEYSDYDILRKHLEENMIYYITWSPYRNMLMNIYTIMNYIRAAKDMNIVFVINRYDTLDDNIFNTFIECAIENNTKIVSASSNEETINKEINVLGKRYNIKSLKILNI